MNNNSNSTRDSKSVTTTVRSHGHSVSPSVTSSTASWLDERIAKERKGVGVNETTSVDREAKNKARNSVGKPGTLREPIDLRDSYNQEASRRVPSRSGSNRQEEGTGTSVPPPKPSRGSNKMVNNSVRSALEDLEKDVLRSLPNTSSKATNFPESLNNSIQEGRTSAKLQTMEQDVVSKAGAKTTTFALTKRLVPSKLNRMEKDATDKASAIGSAASATITQRANAFGVDMEAKARARSKPTGAVVVTKRLNQMEADMAAKQKARGTSSTSAPTKSLNQLELDMAAKARAGSTSINQLQADLAAKAQARCGHLSTKQLSRDFDLAGGNLISRLSEEQDEIIAYKTGAASSSSEHPPGVQAIARPKGNASKMLNPKEGYLTSKGGGVISLEGPYSNGIRKGLDFDMDDFSDDEEAGGLAVAVAVKDYEDDDVFIPAAVEYDPDAKPPMYKNRRFRMYGILGCILLIILLACTIGILAFQEKKGATPTFQIPTSAPTCERCSIGIEEQLELEVGSEKLYDPSTSEFLAKEWIINEDPLQLLPMDANLIQRFLLATFYFETHQLGDWLSCNRQSSDDEDETCSFDRIINIYPLEYEGVPSIRWLSSEHECQWAGINCDELNQTRIIDLPGQDIQGTFPAVLTRLPYVQTITLAWNNFIGQLPDSIGNMKHLLNFEVQYNQFTGNIPLTWSNAKNLQLVNFGGNMLSGQMPTEVGYLRNIKGMFLYENMLTGTFPDEFAQLSLLSKCTQPWDRSLFRTLHQQLSYTIVSFA